MEIRRTVYCDLQVCDGVTVLVAAGAIMSITENATVRPREIKVGVIAENQHPYLLTIDQVCL